MTKYCHMGAHPQVYTTNGLGLILSDATTKKKKKDYKYTYIHTTIYNPCENWYFRS